MAPKPQRRSLDSLESQVLVGSIDSEKKEKKNGPSAQGGHSGPTSPSYVSVPIPGTLQHTGELPYLIHPRKDFREETAFSQLFRPGAVQFALFQHLNAQHAMKLCHIDPLVRRHVRQVLANQLPPSDPNDPISIQDIRPHHYPSDEPCDAIKSFNIGKTRSRVYSMSVMEQWSNCFFFGTATLPKQRLPRPEDHLMNRIRDHQSWAYALQQYRATGPPGRRNVWNVKTGYPKDFNDFFCCRRANHQVKYKKRIFIEKGWWRPVCGSCQSKARGFYPYGYKSCHCAETMVEETCWACTDRLMASFERRSWRITQELPPPVPNIPGLWEFPTLLEFLHAPTRNAPQLRKRIEAWWERSADPTNPQLWCWPVCPCGKEITRLGDYEYPYGVGVGNAFMGGVSAILNREPGWTKACLTCDGIIVEPTVDGPRSSSEDLTSRKALGFPGEEGILDEWERVGRALRREEDVMPFDERGQGCRRMLG